MNEANKNILLLVYWVKSAYLPSLLFVVGFLCFPANCEFRQLLQDEKSVHTNDHDVELEAALKKLLLNLGGDRVETDIALEDGL